MSSKRSRKKGKGARKQNANPQPESGDAGDAGAGPGPRTVASKTWVQGAIAAALVAVVGWWVASNIQIGGTEPAQVSPVSVGTKPSHALDDDDMPELAAAAATAWAGGDIDVAAGPARLGEPSQGVYLAARSGGRRLYHTWGFAGTVADSLEQALDKTREALERKGTADKVDTFEICIAHSYRYMEWDRHRRDLTANAHRGQRGLLIELPDGSQKRYAPTLMLAENRKFEKQIDVALEGTSVDRDEARYAHFDADQILVTLSPTPTAIQMYRGNRWVEPSDVNKASTAELTRLLEHWLINAVQPDGRGVYKYWPSRGEESDSNNMIRQWMATNALIKIAQAHPDRPELWEVSARNIDYNLANFYHDEGPEHGTIEFRNKAKLGAISLAAMALIEHKDRHRWRDQEQRLLAAVKSLWKPSGEFNTWYKKPSGGARELHNFYPGETLLMWATLYQKEPNTEILDMFMKSFEHYREWHLKEKNRNPAFVPWHTQAYYIIWKFTKDDRLKDFIFEMNDWLVDVMLEWDGVLYKDFKGRFYTSKRSYGVPHASSTGVYLEGLIDAYQLAKAVGDQQRTHRYRVAITRGLRSVMQLQFVDDVDMYYISERDKVLGGIRTTVYNNEIRNDNIQHNLMGILKILALFDDSDYQTEM